jgi:hypothetical protein
MTASGQHSTRSTHHPMKKMSGLINISGQTAPR